MKIIDKIALVLVIVGGLNWGLIGISNIDAVAKIFGDMSQVSKIVYMLVGLAALYVAAKSLKILGKQA